MSSTAAEPKEAAYRGFLVFIFRMSKSAGQRELLISPVFTALALQAIRLGHLERTTEHEYRFTDSGWEQATAFAALES
jgi:hypothetical protein